MAAFCRMPSSTLAFLALYMSLLIIQQNVVDLSPYSFSFLLRLVLRDVKLHFFFQAKSSAMTIAFHREAGLSWYPAHTTLWRLSSTSRS